MHDASVHDRNLIIPIVLGVIFLVLTLLSARQRPTLPTSPDGSHGQPPQSSVATNGRAPIVRPIQDVARG